MNPILNYHYDIPFKPVYQFKFTKVNEAVDVTCYEPLIIPKLTNIINALTVEPLSRQQVIQVNSKENKTCLLSLQFQVINKELYLIANFRSQCRVKGRPNDELMLQHIATLVMAGLGLKHYTILVNVGNYHDSTLKE